MFFIDGTLKYLNWLNNSENLVNFKFRNFKFDLKYNFAYNLKNQMLAFIGSNFVQKSC